ncbi:MAG: carboxypeptidase-like regulatory domain-containing protein [Planctomycetota bacterium]
MRPSIATLFAFVLLLAAGGVWLWWSSATSPTAPDAAAAGIVAEPTSATAAQTADAPIRVEAPAAPPTAPPAASSMARGRVVDDVGAPVPEARVWLLPAARAAELGIEAVTGDVSAKLRTEPATPVDARGEFSLAAPQAVGALTLLVSAAGHASLRRDLAPIADQGVDLGSLVLQRGATLRGRVVDADGHDLPGAEVRHGSMTSEIAGGAVEQALVDAVRARIPFVGSGKKTTDGRGRFELHLLGLGKHQLQVTHDDHPRTSLEVEVVEPGQVLDEVLVTMPASASIAGSVVGVPADVVVTVVAAEETKAKVPFLAELGSALDVLDGARVARRATPAADGTFELRGLAVEGRYRVSMLQGTGAFDPACSQAKSVRAPAQRVTLDYEAPLVVTCTVLDAESRAPLPSVDVRANFVRETKMFGTTAHSSSTTTYPGRETDDGRLRLVLRPHPKDTELRLTFFGQGFGALETPSISLTGQRQLDLGVLALDRAPRLVVRVLHAGTGEPVAGAEVSLSVPTERTRLRSRARRSMTGTRHDEREIAAGTTGANGNVELALGEGERGRLRVRRQGFAPAEVELALPKAGAGEHVVELGVGGRIDVRVIDSLGRGVAGARVEVRGTQAGPPSLWVSDADGVAHGEHLAPGRYQVGLKDAPDAPAQEVEVADGAAAEVVLTRPARGLLTGTVTIGGRPAAGIVVGLVPRTDSTALAGRGADAGVAKALLGQLLGAASEAGHTTTDAAGAYRFDAVPLGQYELRLRRGREVISATPRVVVAEDEARCDVALDAAVVEGVVVDAAGQPVAGATVSLATAGGDAGALATLIGGGGEARTASRVAVGADGRFRIEAMAGQGDAHIEASAPRHCASRSTRFTLRAGSSVEGLRIVLVRGGTLRVRVAGGGNAFLVSAEPAGAAGQAQTVLVRDGVADFGVLAPGRWRVRAGDGPTTEVDVVADQVAEAVLGG